MKVINYLKRVGVKRALEVLYRYKLQTLINNVVLFFLKRKELKNIIVIESHNDFDCNGGAFYNFLIKNGYNENYKIIWLIKYRKPNILPKNVFCINLFKPSFKKAYYNCVAKYFLADSVVMPKLREEQKSFYLSHGSVCLKNVIGLINLPYNIDYVLSPSENFDEIYGKICSIDKTNGKLIHVGFPCNDVFYEKTDSELKKLTNTDYTKVFLWMPTFRKGVSFNRNDSLDEQPLGIPLIKKMEDFEKLNKKLKELDSLLIIKIHPKQDLSSLKIENKSNIIVLTNHDMKKYNLDNYRLYKDVDAMISDYSSASYDFLFLNRPIAYDFSDLKSYKLSLLFEHPEDYMAGPIIKGVADLFKFISSVVHSRDDYEKKRVSLFNYLYKYNDGNSCRRLAEFMGLKGENNL